MEDKTDFPPTFPISRRRFIERAGLGFAGAAAAGLAVQSAFAQIAGDKPSRPNILLLIADDAGWHDVGYNGSEIRTPNIDKLAGQGVQMEQFYACPTCSPTRASILMGRPPSRYGILEPIAGRSTQVLPTDQGTLASLLRDAGYFTAQVGKWHLGLQPENGPNKYGFTSSYGYLHGQLDQLSHIYKNGDPTWQRDGKFIEEKGHATDLIAQETIRLIRVSDPRRPFFIYSAFSVPHYPLQEEEKWIAPYEKTIQNKSRRLYAAAMTHMDEAIGGILSALEKKRITSNTLVIFISDNGAQQDWVSSEREYGGAYGPYDVLGDNKPFRDWKGSVYEGGVRVPAIFSLPGWLNRRKVGYPAHVMDLLPTFAALAGAAIPQPLKVEGQDISTLLEGKLGGSRTFYWNTGGQLALRQGDWKLVHQGGDPAKGADELYNIAHDPYEKQDLSASETTVLMQLRDNLARQHSLDSLPKPAPGGN
ncbi:MAG: hypothetical protein A3F83_13360 [Candidatus Glassbacteria bacterium RIFCSPLOWO2_12_FULL_58_11]|uniref:Sulfatase N-terminal domain-containing protein n=1 Tax=Candidatus Glassbacteria bacterium RIFCSPLOWO2_12_FULL_58_11 TaxID=1817867 RepID=A0A1F5YMC8_9BACT|nr:MAG: hypothetical protein A3F83_13360 [Candidatus Glassbacteria bacterium RIFCSPLOWO2_12_FULL_58_11]